MLDVRKIRIEDFDYPLPEERIALHPLEKRDACRLLVTGSAGRISHQAFSDLPILLRPDTLIVANETKVIRARMEFVKDTGARIEIFLLEPVDPHDYAVSFASSERCSWSCMIGNRKRWKEGLLHKALEIGGRKVILTARLEESEGNVVSFSWDNPSFTFAEIIEAAGNIPIPPYLKRESEESDLRDYQTVYSRTEGSVAAPTAGLHFTPELISELKKYGNEFATVTLHVGAGTFQPVKSEEIGDHPMHKEWISVSRHTLARLISALENGRDILAVGTTSVRTLESLPYMGALVAGKGKCLESPGPGEHGLNLTVTQWMPYEGGLKDIDTAEALRSLLEYMDVSGLETIEATTSIMIAPGFRWRIVNRLITNFHQPKSTLLLLVSSFLGHTDWRRVYDEALSEGYRFLSYGDACLFSRGAQPVELPLSKSMALRAATIYAVRYPDSPGLLDRVPAASDDVCHFLSSLKTCMASRLSSGLQTCNIGEGAAPLRFLLAYAASLPGAKLRITCEPSLRRRPIRPLIDTLTRMGAVIEFDDSPANWEIRVMGKILRGEDLKVDTTFTSQFLSALILVAPLWAGKTPSLDEAVGKAAVSRPYLKMTEEMTSRKDIEIEPDWSAAAFFYEYALIARRGVAFSSLTPPAESLQGDSAVCDLYGMLGVRSDFHTERHNRPADHTACLTFDRTAFDLARQRGEFEYDFTDSPDMVPSVAVALCYCRIPFRFHGVGHLRFKECDRLAALNTLLVRLGYDVRVEDDTLLFTGDFRPLEEFPLEIDPYGDHRMAMAFYPLEQLGMVIVEDKGVVSKSFPNFYQQFKNLG